MALSFKIPRGMGGPPKPAPKMAMEARYTVNTNEFQILRKNLSVLFEDLIPSIAAQTSAHIAIDTLRNALPRTPIASEPDGTPLPEGGRLRESGRATVLYRGGKEFAEVGFGQKSGGVKVDLGRLKTARGAFRGSGTVGARVTFHRVNEAGEDIALWAHEDLLPYVPRPGGVKPAALRGYFVARHPGTQPKYLESAFNERKSRYIALYRRVLNNQAISKAAERLGGRRYTGRIAGLGRFKTAIVYLDPNKIRSVLEGVRL